MSKLNNYQLLFSTFYIASLNTSEHKKTAQKLLLGQLVDCF